MQTRSATAFSSWVLLLAGAAAAAEPQGGALRSIFGAEKAPSREALAAYLSDRVVELKPDLADDQEYSLGADGSADISSEEFDQALSVTRCGCRSAGKHSLKGSVLNLACSFSCITSYSGNADPTPPDSESPRRRESVDFKLVLVSSDALLVTRGPARWLARDCAAGGRCAVPRFKGLLVQVIPGAADRGLFESVRGALQRAQGDFAVFQGAPAKKPRVESEVLYTEGHRSDAEAIARQLAPVIGPVTPAPWPGAWDYDVVVVVGSKAAAAK